MSTWAGAVVGTKSGGDLAEIAAKHRIALQGAVPPFLLVEAEVGWGSLRPPVFAEALSRELQSDVVSFFLQTNASVEQIEHWRKGQLVRKLEYTGDGGGWISQVGAPQDWEPDYFFADDESTAEGGKWPLNLGDELTDDDLARYNRAKAAKDATSIMDLLGGGSPWGIHRLCRHFGCDPDKPGARYTPPTNRKPRIIVAAIVVFILGMFLLGALSHR